VVIPHKATTLGQTRFGRVDMNSTLRWQNSPGSMEKLAQPALRSEPHRVSHCATVEVVLSIQRAVCGGVASEQICGVSHRAVHHRAVHHRTGPGRVSVLAICRSPFVAARGRTARSLHGRYQTVRALFVRTRPTTRERASGGNCICHLRPSRRVGGKRAVPPGIFVAQLAPSTAK